MDRSTLAKVLVTIIYPWLVSLPKWKWPYNITFETFDGDIEFLPRDRLACLPKAVLYSSLHESLLALEENERDGSNPRG